MLAVATAGLAINLLAYLVLSRGDRGNLNLRAALMHVVGDLLGSAGAIGAALVILATGWTPIDPILSVLVALLILRSAWRWCARAPTSCSRARRPASTPRRSPPTCATTVPEVTAVRHLHAWSITEARPMVTLEAVLAPGRRPRRRPPRGSRRGSPSARLRPRHRRDLRRGRRTTAVALPAPAAYLGGSAASGRPPMPIKIPATLPAHDVLRREGVMVMSEETALRQDIRPLQIGLLNLMPKKVQTETQFARLIGATPLQIELTLIRMSEHQPKNTSAAHLEAFYQPFREARDAPLRRADRHRRADRAPRLRGGQLLGRAARALRLDPDQRPLDHGRLLGRHGDAAPLPRHRRSTCCRPRPSAASATSRVEPSSALLQGFSDSFLVPVSRWTEVRDEDVALHARSCGC